MFVESLEKLKNCKVHLQYAAVSMFQSEVHKTSLNSRIIFPSNIKKNYISFPVFVCLLSRHHIFFLFAYLFSPLSNYNAGS